MKLSVVSTIYRSAAYLSEFVRRVDAACSGLTADYELILVNDGSPDDSLSVALELQRNYAFVRILDLARNFGHHAAIVAGLDKANGDYIFLIDSDLEEQPEWLPRFFEELRSSDVDVVFGVQERRIAGGASNFFGETFWASINFMSSVRIPRNPMTCRLMTREYLSALRTIEDKVLYLAGVFAWTGFRQKAIPLTKTPRPHGHRSSYSLSRRFNQVVESFSSFSTAPLYLVFLAGIVTWAASLIFGAYLFIMKLFWPASVEGGFTSLMLSIWFFSGLIILAIGIVGLYLAKIFQEVKRRPLYIVRRLYEGVSDVRT